jgi:hypothetical protein
VAPTPWLHCGRCCSMAALGLALALLTGLWLFSVRPVDYAFNTAFNASWPCWC